MELLTKQGFSVRFGTPSDREALQRFNERLEAGGVKYRMPLNERLPGESIAPPDYFVHRRQLLVVEGEEVRGGVLLQHHRISVRGDEQPFCWLQLPLSEGLVNPDYASTILLLLKNALRHQKIAMGLGVGSLEEKWSQLLIRTGWDHHVVPFFFYPVNLRRVALELRYLESRRALKLAASVAAYSGAASMVSGIQKAFRSNRLSASGAISTRCADFDDWADRIYKRCAPEYGALANRDAMTLRVLYPPQDQRYVRLRVLSKATGQEIGWVIVVHKRMKDDKYFGNLYVGTIVNGCCDPKHADAVIAAGLQELIELGVDLVVSNWSHGAWRAASRSLGFLNGPSNFIFFLSPHAKPILESIGGVQETHMTRGDCDSPSALMPRVSSSSPTDPA